MDTSPEDLTLMFSDSYVFRPLDVTDSDLNFCMGVKRGFYPRIEHVLTKLWEEEE